MSLHGSVVKDLENLMDLLNSTPTSGVFQSFPLQNLRIEEYTVGAGTHRMWFEAAKEEEAEGIESAEVLIVANDVENGDDPGWFLFKGRRASERATLPFVGLSYRDTGIIIVSQLHWTGEPPLAAVKLDLIAKELCVIKGNGRSTLRGITPELVIEALIASIEYDDMIILEAVLGYFTESGEWIDDPTGPYWILQSTTCGSATTARRCIKRYSPCFYLPPMYPCLG
ncbi:hypothetical protein BKA70DRAFT_1229151 [Coprinopsis sp. MPI-PUGE-AT-0042]|nr:hypothetical protein BKA70DRAFT_1229151 [Coprinopsis sp. MPI-PUGE-AT-0042]